MIEKNITGEVTRVMTKDGHPTLYTDYGTIEESLERAKERYRRDKEDYFMTLGDDPALLKKTKRWQRSARELAKWAGTMFNAYGADQPERQAAAELFDKISKESKIRLKNIERYADIQNEKAEKTGNQEIIDSVREEMDNAEFSAAAFLRSAIETQSRYLDLLQRGENYIPRQQQEEAEAAARVAEFREKVIPRDILFLPGRIIPPYPVPRTERVPRTPDAYELAFNQPIEAYEFDRDLQEIVIKKGYVSEDGLIDDETIQYDLENGKCTIKYRGGVPVTWDFWKPKDTFDVPVRGSWLAEYMIRSYQQRLEDEAFGILKHRADEDEILPYNVKPVGNRQ